MSVLYGGVVGVFVVVSAVVYDVVVGDVDDNVWC